MAWATDREAGRTARFCLNTPIPTCSEQEYMPSTAWDPNPNPKPKPHRHPAEVLLLEVVDRWSAAVGGHGEDSLHRVGGDEVLGGVQAHRRPFPPSGDWWFHPFGEQHRDDA